LGPLLFILFLNDIVNSTNGPKFVTYADDCTVYTKNQNLDELIFRSEANQLAINNWSTINKLNINLKKTKFILFTFNKNIKSNINVLKIKDFSIDRVKNFKLLGVYIDSNLNFKMHVQHISSRINFSIGIIFRLKNFVNQPSRKILYYSLIFSHLYYCNLIWGCANTTTIQKLFVVQNKSVKFLFSPNFHNKLITNDIFFKNKILTIFEINSFKSCSLIFKLFNNKIIMTDEYLLNFIHISQCESHFIRSSNHRIKTLVIKNMYSKRNFIFMVQIIGTNYLNI